MPLLTKSVQKDRENTDGIRVCIMRKPDFNADWDIWMPKLAPSLELLTAYHKGDISWPEFETTFVQKVLPEVGEYIEILVDMAKKRVVTILCWEETPEMCHRRLVAEECKRRYPDLEVEIN